jgi:hypothetical protein
MMEFVLLLLCRLFVCLRPKYLLQKKNDEFFMVCICVSSREAFFRLVLVYS